MIAPLFNGHAESKFVLEMLAFPEQTMQFWQIVPEFAVFPEQLLKILFREYCLRHFSGVSSATLLFSRVPEAAYGNRGGRN